MTFLLSSHPGKTNPLPTAELAMSLPFLPCFPSLFLLLVIFHIPTSNGEPAKFECNNTYNGITSPNYTLNSIFQSNLNILLHSLSSSVSLTKGFYNTSIGEGSDKVYGLVLCRGDVPPDICRNCTNCASDDLLSRCQSRSSIIWYDLCQVQYSDTNFFDILEDKVWWFGVHSQINMTDSEVEPFKNSREQLMRDLANKTAYEPCLFATGKRNYSWSNNVYGLMQCKPVITAEACHTCLNVAVKKIPEYTHSAIGGRVVSEVCSLRFENSSFFRDSRCPERDNNSSRIIVILIPILIAVTIFSSIKFVVLRWKKRVSSRMRKTETLTFGSSTEKSTMDQPDGTAPLLQFNFEMIRVATNGFSDGNKLGKGGFGAVHKGRLLDGRKIAVKRLSIDSKQGEEQFMNEVELSSKLKHKNLVQLYGCCVEGQEKLLIYEYIPNKSLDYVLFGTGPDRDKWPSLNWEHRFRIIGGIAKGLLYLHEDLPLKIIHRDLKASNILLDANMVPKISDFGLAKTLEAGQTRVDTNRLAGTFGYMAPEYVRRGELSVKSDVFSFGVLLLEIVTGQRNAYESNRGGDNLIRYVWKAWNDETISKIIDSRISTSEHFCKSEVWRCIHIGLLCVQEDAKSRPNMSLVVTMLTPCSIPPQPPSTPAFLR